MHGDTRRFRLGRHFRLLAVLGVLGAALVGCGSDGGGSTPAADKSGTTKPAKLTGAVFTDADFGFNFSYPKDWTVGELKGDADLSAGPKPAARAAVGFDEQNAILLARYDLRAAVTAADLPDLMPDLNGIVTQFAGTPYSGTITDINGLPAVSYDEFALPADSDGRRSLVTFVFDGDKEYELNCQSTADGNQRVREGCDQMLSTLRKK